MNQKPLSPIDEEENQDKLIWQSSASGFTKAQKDFNDALNKHKQAIQRVQEIEAYIEIANEAYYQQIIPELQKQKELEKKRLEMMSVIFLEDLVKLSKQQKENLRQLILETSFEKLKEDRDFYFDLIKKLETTAERNQRIALKQKAERQLKQQFGVDVDIDELNKTNFSSEEERQQHQEKFKEFFEKYHQQQAGDHTDFFSEFKNQRERKKSKAQQEKEKKLAEAEKLLNTDINKLFKDLAKLIHPDREQDPVLRDKKEALMKELSNARDSMNIAEILRIKMLVDDLIPNNQSVLSFNDATIKRFVSIIKTKIQELENTVAQKLYAHPLLEDLNLRHLTTEGIKKYISKEVKHSKHLTNSCEIEIDELLNNPKYIKAIIDDYIDMNGLEPFWR
jgi:hypothetical protein